MLGPELDWCQASQIGLALSRSVYRSRRGSLTAPTDSTIWKVVTIPSKLSQDRLGQFWKADAGYFRRSSAGSPKLVHDRGRPLLPRQNGRFCDGPLGKLSGAAEGSAVAVASKYRLAAPSAQVPE